MMNILVIGGTGLLSKAVVDVAVQNGIFVTIIHRNNNVSRVPIGVTSIVADINHDDQIRRVLRNTYFDAVLDFVCWNITSLSHNIELLKAYTAHYYFVSSTCVYDTSILGEKYEASKKILKQWSYSEEKWECEEYLRKQTSKYGIKYTIIRPCLTYDDIRIPYAITPTYKFHRTILERVKSGKPMPMINDGSARWNMTRVEDFAQAFVGLLDNDAANNNEFNICGDVTYSWNDVLQEIEQYLATKIQRFNVPIERYTEFLPSIAGELWGRSFDSINSNEKLKMAIPYWKQHYNLHDGIRMTLDHYALNSSTPIDYAWDAEQDYLLSKVDVFYKGKYISYDNSCFFVKIKNRCDWEISYHRDDRIRCKVWKAVKKILMKL